MSTAFYNGAYFESHYGRLLNDDGYFSVRALFWKKAITSLWSVPEESRMLDYGCGTGQVTAAFRHCDYYDISEESRNYVRKMEKTVFEQPGEIPREQYDFVLSSHSLEHSPRPFDDLLSFAQYARSNGHLLLILPVEKTTREVLKVDNNNHLYGWTFQTISNLLLASGWEPLFQAYIYDSFGLGTLAKRLHPENAVWWSWRLGLLRKSFKSMFIVARKNGRP